MRAAARSVTRSSAPRPEVAIRAARDFDRSLGGAVAAEIRWTFTPPRSWLSGLLTNLLLAAVWLAAQPSLTPQGRHHDWVVVVGTYFSSFVLADVTTTNLLGADHYRVLTGLHAGVPPWKVMVVKNVTLLILVGLPTAIAATGLTLWLETPQRLAVTLPNVAVPIITWLGIGNLVSALWPVAAAPLTRRWRQRHDRRRIGAWALALGLPYVLYYVADPIYGIDHHFFWDAVPNAIGPVLGRDSKSFVHLGIAVIVWLLCTIAADLWVRKRGLRVS